MSYYLTPHVIRRSIARNAAHTLPVDVQDAGDAYTLTAFAPGAQPETINIQVLDDVVSIEGEFAAREAEYLLRETPAGAFRRVLRLPVPLNAEQVEASLDQGILTLRLPKAESARPRTIKVNYN